MNLNKLQYFGINKWCKTQIYSCFLKKNHQLKAMYYPHDLFDTILQAGRLVELDWPRGLFHSEFFHRTSNPIPISFCYHSKSDTVIAIKFRTNHHSTAVMSCKIIWNVPSARNWIIVKQISNEIWIIVQKMQVKWVFSWHLMTSLKA